MKTYAFGRVEKLLTAGPGRVRQDCPVAGPCGGCGLRHISYEAECAAKTQFVRDAFARLGKLDVPVPDMLGAPDTDRYRNKVQFPVGWTRTVTPASASTPGALTASSPARTAACSPVC